MNLLNDKLKVSDATLKLVVLDACRDDPRPAGRRSVQGLVDFDYGLPPDGVVTITSCSKGKIAREDEKLGRGVFMHYFLEGLDGKASGDDGIVTLGRLFDYVSSETDKYVANKWADVQKPVMLPATVEKVALIRPTDRRPLVANVPARSEMLGGRSVKPGEVITNSIGMKLALIPAGEFQMGSPATEEGRSDDEQRRRVRITKPFYLGVYEVTQEEYQQVMGANPSSFSISGNSKDDVQDKDTRRFPVDEVTWTNAIEFCRRLTEIDGRAYRLPTEAEWEYACRAGTTTKYSTGDDERSLAEMGWYRGLSAKRTNIVGQKRPNAFGLYDMHGNVWEWCADSYDVNEYGRSSSTIDPQGGSDEYIRVFRGGGWSSSPVFCRSAYRGKYARYHSTNDLGFRVAAVPSD